MEGICFTLNLFPLNDRVAVKSPLKGLCLCYIHRTPKGIYFSYPMSEV